MIELKVSIMFNRVDFLPSGAPKGVLSNIHVNVDKAKEGKEMKEFKPQNNKDEYIKSLEEDNMELKRELFSLKRENYRQAQDMYYELRKLKEALSF